VTAEPRLVTPEDVTDLVAASDGALFLDVDGTLVEIKPRPEDVVAEGSLIEILAGLEAAYGGALALVSGRRIDDVDRIFAPRHFAAAGLHGAELRFPDGTRVAASSAVMDAVRPRILDFVAALDGVWLEDKGATLAVHFRQRPELESRVLAFLGPFARDGLVVQEGKMVAELKESRHDKGSAIAAFLAVAPFAGRTPVFVGDDRTDETGFALVNTRGGIAIRVGSAEVATQARFRLDDPAALRRVLELLVAEGPGAAGADP
jgi:trehalose 6-phosphate phosphatase